ncbi:MAG: S41 family peptidase [Acidobacteriota bacterium]|nr:S41 family peptidase [Acidobacteriota bacterium]
MRDACFSRRAAVIILLLAGLGQGLFAATRAAGPQADASGAAAPSVDSWAGDIDALVLELPRRHINLFAKIPEAEFLAAAASLKASLPASSQEEILAGVMKLIASIGDSHTALGYWPRRLFPLMVYWYDDGLWIRNTLPEYREILNCRITAVEGRSIEDVIPALADLIPHENDSQVRGLLPGLLADPSLLHGLKVIPRPGAARFTVRDAAGVERTADLRAASFSGQPAWIEDPNAADSGLLYLKNRRQDYWFEILGGSATLYFQYNSCRETPGRPFAAFVGGMFAVAEEAGANRVVVDLRLNGGGKSEVFRPFIDALKSRPAFNRRGNVFVLIGRRTFSSALMNAVDLKKETAAILAGEPTGGKPNHFGEIQRFRLPGSGLFVSYSTKYFKQVDGDPASLEPEVRVAVNFADHRSSRDPVLEAVLALNR